MSKGSNNTKEFKKLFQIRWGEKLGYEKSPYLIRWTVILFGYTIRVHHWIKSDDNRYLHDHSSWLISIVLRGFYWNVKPSKPNSTPTIGDKYMAADLDRHTTYFRNETYNYVEGMFNSWKNFWHLKNSIWFSKATDRHWLCIPKEGAWTLLIEGRPQIKWGFWVVNNKTGELVKWRPLKRYGVYYFLKKNNISFNRKLGNKHDMIGKQFGYLTVLDIVKNEKSTKSSPYRAICYCSNCGNNNFDVNPQSLIRKRTTSCGCSKDRYVKTTGKNSIQYTGYEELNGKYWGTIKKRAENRGYSICVDIKYAWDLYVKQNRKCALSGLSIEFAISNRKVCETTASLDRIDSTKGYVEGNVQWVHKHVNIMKNVFEQNYFIELCALIAKNCNKI